MVIWTPGDPDPGHFPAWLQSLQLKGWQVVVKPATNGGSLLVAGKPPERAHISGGH